MMISEEVNNNISLEVIGKRLKKYRSNLDLNQKGLAEKTGLTQNVITRVENANSVGSENWITLITFFAKHFNVRYLFEDQFKVIERSDEIVEVDYKEFNSQVAELQEQVYLAIDKIKQTN